MRNSKSFFIILIIITSSLIFHSCTNNSPTSTSSNNDSVNNSSTQQSFGVELARTVPITSNGYSVVVGKDTLITSYRDSSATVTVSIPYTYTYPIRITDTAWHRFSESVPTNKPPVADAGADQTITLPVSSVTLTGFGTDPDGTIASYSWSKVSGGTASINPINTASTTISDLVQGVYTFRLSVVDNLGTGAVDDVIITVNAGASTSFTIEGFGANAIGGSNSSVIYHVTNLNSSGSGSLMNGIGSNKTIVFDISGTIYDTRIDLINISYLTIDATGKDVLLDNHTASGGVGHGGDILSADQGSHHIIFKNLSVTNAGNDGINVINGAHDVAITNCMSWNNSDGEIDIAGANNVTVQWCIMGASVTGGPGCMLITSTNVSAHHNLYSPAKPNTPGERCPFVHCNYSPVGNPNADVRNNLIWKFGRDNGNGSGYGTAIGYNATGNIINNFYYTAGVSKTNATSTSDGYGTGNTGKVYASGNVSGNGYDPNLISNHAIFPFATVTTQDACTAAALVLANAGPNPKSRNAVASGYVNAVSLSTCK